MENLILGPATIAFGVMIAAFIAGYFSFINLINAKEQKISEFRQAWIDSLRQSISEYISALSYLSILYEHYSEKKSGHKDGFEMVKGVNDVYSKVNSTYNDIIFRINDSENEKTAQDINNNFLEALRKTRDLYNQTSYGDALKACDQLRDMTKPLLKKEWELVKRGEPAYVKARKISVVVLIIGVVFVIADFVFISYNALAVKNDVVASPKITTPNKNIQQTAEEHRD